MNPRVIVKTKRWDLGEIVRNYIYVREIYATCYNEKERCLFSSKDLFNKLSLLYDYLGVKKSTNEEIRVKIKLPSNPNPRLRDQWHETSIKKSNDNHLITKIDRLYRYFKNEVVFATNVWMGDFETFPGDEVVISCCYPVPSSKHDLSSKFCLKEATRA